MRRWTQDEIESLRQYYPDYGVEYCADLLNRSHQAIKKRTSVLGLRTCFFPSTWTQNEISELKKYYSTRGGRYCAELLNKTRQTVYKKARKLKIRTSIIDGPIIKSWTPEENNILIKYYSEYGSKYCTNLLDRSQRSIRCRALILNLTTTVVSWGAPQKQIIKKLEGNRVIALCKKHGETPHYFHHGKIVGCVECQSCHNKISNQTDRMKKYQNEWQKRDRQTPLGLYKSRLRGSLKSAFKRHLQNNGINKKIGCFRHLPYSPRQLCDHLEKIKKRQGDQCPICRRSYNITGFNIDHVIPLVTAQTEKEMLELFDLVNLSILCPKCNGNKGTRILACDEKERMQLHGY